MKEYIVAVDIASKRDRYAEVVLRRHVYLQEGNRNTRSENRVLSELQIVWMKQEEALRYEDMENSYMSLIRRPELLDNCDELVDGTGVGDAVIESLRKRGAFPVSIVFTNGGRAHPVYAEIGQVFGDSRAGELALMRTVKEWLVPRKELVADLALIFEQGRISIGRKVNHREALEAQLTGFRLNQKKVKYEAETEELHDDLVTDLMMACWWTHYFESEIPEGELLDKSFESTTWDPLEQFNIKDEPSRSDVPMSVQSWR